jgi:uncharacterized damage-inducible protein DinB
MFIEPELDPRTDPAPTADEKSTLVAFLKFQRDTLELKCSGLDAEQLARRSVEPSGLSLLGIVRHMAGVELTWFRQVMSKQYVSRPFRSTSDPDAEFTGAKGDPRAVEEAWAAWRSEVAYAERFVESSALDRVGNDEGRGEISLRWVLVHMIEEYARHLGHADLLRERIDGRTGQ